MRFAVALALVGMTGCWDITPKLDVDAGADATVGPDAEPPAVRLEPGEYAVSWSCVSGCVTSIPAVSYNRATVTEGEIAYWYVQCPSCRVTDTITERTVECVSGAGIPQGDEARPTQPYEVCPGPGAAVATIRYMGYPGPPSLERVWTMSASPLP